MLAGVLGAALVGSLAMGFAPSASQASASCSGPTVTKQAFGSAFDLYAGHNLPVFRYILKNCHNVTADILIYGGITQSVTVPDKSGNLADVLLGFKTLGEYVAEASPPPPAPGGPYFGEIIGRYANRIANGSFKIGNNTYTIPVNNGVNSLHGGFVGFGNHVWASTPVHVSGMAGVQLKLVSPDGDGGENVGCVVGTTSCTGYPGTLTLTVTYLLDNNGDLFMHYHATVAGKPTVVNLPATAAW